MLLNEIVFWQKQNIMLSGSSFTDTTYEANSRLKEFNIFIQILLILETNILYK